MCKTKIQTKCEHCGKIFGALISEVNRGKGRFCSLKCYYSWHSGKNCNLAKNGTTKRACAECGKSFDYWKGKVSRIFCSPECFHKHQSSRGEDKICPICGTGFHVSPSTIKKGKGILCSPECSRIWASRNNIKKICLECNSEYEVVPAIAKKGHGNFCSRKCLSKWRSKNLSGENSASWKGGLTPKNALIRASAEYHQWRMDVVTRDNFKCKRCGETGGEIHAHHILSFSKHPELRFDINNGITLCDKCHSEIHGHNVSIKHLKKAEIA